MAVARGQAVVAAARVCQRVGGAAMVVEQQWWGCGPATMAGRGAVAMEAHKAMTDIEVSIFNFFRQLMLNQLAILVKLISILVGLVRSFFSIVILMRDNNICFQ